MSCNPCNTNPCNPCGPSQCGPSLGSYQYCPPNCWGGPAYNVKCSQTNFCKSSNIIINTPNGSTTDTCTGATALNIEGSGLSIVGGCGGQGDSPMVFVAGTICSCPNNFSTTVSYNVDEGSTTTIYIGNMTWCVCGCNVCATGQLKSLDGSANGSISIQGCVSSVCGIRTICITSITITI